MKAKEYLKEIRKLDNQIDADFEELECLEALATKTTSVLGNEKVQSSGSQQKMAECVGKIIEMQYKLNQEINKYIEHKMEVRELVRKACDADCMTLLRKKYFGVYDKENHRIVYRTWEQIAIEMNFTYQWVSGGLHQRALAQVQKALDERNK